MLVGRPEPSGLHVQRVEHFLLQVVFPLHAGDDFDNGCTDIDTCIGVCDAGTRFEQDRRGCCNGSYLAKRGTTAPTSTTYVVTLGTDFERESAGVVEHHADGEHVLGLAEHANAILIVFLYPKFAELRKVLGYGIVQRELAFFYQLGNGYTAEAFGLRALHEHVVHLDGALLSHVGISDAAGFLNAVLVEHADGTSQLTAIDIGLEGFFGIRGLGLYSLGLGSHRQHHANGCQEQYESFFHDNRIYWVIVISSGSVPGYACFVQTG